MAIRISAAIAAAAAFFALATAPVSGTVVRTFVSGKGADSGSCSLVAPCRTFTFALAATTPSGEIVVLDSAGYGAVNITKPITISNQTGVEGAITVNSGDAITVNLTNPGTVTLRGLTLDGANSAGNGINLASVTGAAHLLIQHCAVRNFSTDGLRVLYPQAGAFVTVIVSDSTFIGNAHDGIYISPPAGSLNASISRTTAALNTNDGIAFQSGPGSANVEISDVHSTANGQSGVAALGSAGAMVMWLRNSVLTFNSTDLLNNFTGTGGLRVFDRNLMSSLSDTAGAHTYTDHTNNVESVSVVMTGDPPQ